MRGNDHPGMVIQERDRHLLRELAVMRVIDQDQAKTVAGFGSTTRVNVRLLGLARAGLLRRFFLGTTAGGRKALYSLSAKGAAMVGVPERGVRRRNDEVLVANLFVEHQLAVNRLYCALKYGTNLPTGVTFRRWLGFYSPLAPGLRLIPDGYCELQTSSSMFAAFIELDLGSETLAVWKAKVQNYLHYALSGTFEKQFGQDRFRVLVLAHSDRRLQSIRKAVAASTEKVFWFSSLQRIERDGLFGAVWLRPKGDERRPLIKEMP